MKRGNGIRWICRVMVCLMAVITLAGFVVMPSAQADGVTVTIKSFMRGVYADNSIRNSELMEAVVTGYDGNTNELIYEWKNVDCSADLYLFNSYNMAHIDDTPGEKRDISRGESDYGTGFAWAAMRRRGANNYRGTITVTVKTPDGTVLASDNYKDFLAPDLGDDLDGVAFGVFIGEKVNVKDLLGHSAIVHITCQGATVSEGRIADSTIAKLTRDGDYMVEGLKKGYTEASITVSKSMCSFHNSEKITVVTPLYVFRKPTTSTTTTTLTLRDLDPDCDYFIGSMQGERVGDTVVFSGLTPNTTYVVTARGSFPDGNKTEYAYAYVSDTTKPVYSATVNVYLNGTRKDIEDIYGNATALYLKDMDDNSAQYIPLNRTETGVYTVGLENGRYQVYRYENGTYVQENTAFLQINSHSAKIDLHHYSVSYDTKNGSFAQGKDPGTVIYPVGSAVFVTEEVPVRPGYSFTGWKYGNRTYQPGDRIVSSISSAIELSAQWEKAASITINVTIDHQGGSGYDQLEGKADLEVYLLEKKNGSAALETGDELYFSRTGVTDEDGNDMPYNYKPTYREGVENTPENVLVTAYEASAVTYVDRSSKSSFDVKVQKSGYDVKEVSSRQDKDGNWIIDVSLKFNPSNFDLKFSVQMADSVPVDLYPAAVIYKVAFWATDRNAWEIITQMEDDKGGVRLNIDPATGYGSGSYPVWRYENAEPYGYRVVVTGFVYDDHTITVPHEAPDTVISYTDDNYTATMQEVTGGQSYGGLAGAYYDGTEQRGTLAAVVTVAAFDVTFNAMGGTISGKNSLTLDEQHYIPDLDDYTPVKEDHGFLGWYMDDEYTKPAKSGELLTENVELYARWDRVLTGSVTVEGTYQQNGQTVAVWERDLVRSVNVILQEITGNSTLNVDSCEISVDWDEDDKIGKTEEYKFTGLLPDKDYRVVFDAVNYTATYRNAQSGTDYNATDYFAAYDDDDLKTFVDGYLKFTPVSYEQPVTVDAAQIGENFRPDSVLAQILYCAPGNGEWKIISQHTVSPNGIVMEMNENGLPTQNYAESVWASEWDGDLYEYQVQIGKIDNTAADDCPVIIHYSSSSRWNPYTNAPTDTLKATLVPNIYDIIYILNDGTDAQETGAHTWSFDTQIDKVPEREGYTFKGWYDNANCTGSEITSIPAATCDDIVLYAKWEIRSDLQLTINHVDANTSETLETQTRDVTFGDVIESATLQKEIKGYTYTGCTPVSVTITTGTNVVTLTYTRNSYDYTVDYLENGTNKKLLESKQGRGEYGAEITENAESVSGYTVDAETKKITVDTENNKIVFLYTKRSDLSYQVNYLDEVTLAPVYTARTVQNVTYQDEVTAEDEIVDIIGYTCVGADKEKLTIGVDESANVINLYYAVDNLLDSDQTTASDDKDKLEGGDDVPDKYQKKIVFKVDNGTWADGTADDILEIVTLMKDGKWDETGSASLTAPNGMLPADGYLQESGAWDAEVLPVVSGTADVTYTYTFLRSLTPVRPGDVVNYIVEHYKADANDVYPTEPTETEILGDKIGNTVTAAAKSYAGYCLNPQESTMSGVLKEIKGDGDILILKLFYNKDDKCPDDVPDKYQKKVTFKVLNGTWADGTTKDIVVYATLMKDGKWNAEGSASLTTPSGMKALANFTGGQWDITPPAVANGLNDEVYTYYYLPQINVPQTGDPMSPVLWLMLMGGSFLLFALCAFKRKSGWNM